MLNESSVMVSLLARIGFSRTEEKTWPAAWNAGRSKRIIKNLRSGSIFNKGKILKQEKRQQN